MPRKLFLALLLLATALLAQTSVPGIKIRSLPICSSPAGSDLFPAATSGGVTCAQSRTQIVANLCPASRTISCTAPLLCGGGASHDMASDFTLALGIVPTAKLGSGTASSSTFLRGDQTWATPAGSGTVTSVALSLPSWLSVAGSPVTTTGTLAVTAAAGQAADRVIGTCAGASSVSLCALTVSQLPTVTTAKGGLGADNSAATGIPVFASGTTTITTATGSGAPMRGTSPTATDATVNPAANGDTAITSTRPTDTSPSGHFALYKSAGGASLWDVDINGNLAVGIVPTGRLTGQAIVPNGGTGAGTLAAHGVVLGNSTSAVNVTGAGTVGQVFTSNGPSADPTFQTPSGGGALKIAKASTESQTANTTLTNDGALSLTVASDTVYAVSALLRVETNSGVGFKMALGGSATYSVLAAYAHATDGTATKAFPDHQLVVQGTLDGSSPEDPLTYAIILEATVAVTTGGTVTIQWAQNTSSGTLTKVKLGSRLRAEAQ